MGGDLFWDLLLVSILGLFSVPSNALGQPELHFA